MVQLSDLYMTTGKIRASTIWTFVSKVISLILNTLSRFVQLFFQGVLWLQSLSAVIWEQNLSQFPLFLHLFGSDGTRYHDLSFLNAEF